MATLRSTLSDPISLNVLAKPQDGDALFQLQGDTDMCTRHISQTLFNHITGENRSKFNEVAAQRLVEKCRQA